MTPQERVNRANKFAACREPLDELFQGVRQFLRDEIENASRPEDILDMHRSLQNLHKLTVALQRVVSDGQVAEATLKAEQLHRG